MAILNSTITKPVLDLSGEDGNVFFLISQVTKFGKQLGIDVKSVVADMVSDDYMHALYVFDRALGNYIDLRLPECMTTEDYHEEKSIKDNAFTLSNIIDSLKK